MATDSNWDDPIWSQPNVHVSSSGSWLDAESTQEDQ